MVPVAMASLIDFSGFSKMWVARLWQSTQSIFRFSALAICSGVKVLSVERYSVTLPSYSACTQGISWRFSSVAM